MADNRNSARKGKAVELLVAASAMLASEGKLNASTSLIDDEGVDLVFNRRGATGTLAIQVKSRFTSAKGLKERNSFMTQVRDVAFEPRDDLYLLFVAVDPKRVVMDPLWLVPSKVFDKKSLPNAKGRRRFVASAKPDAKDQWSKFRTTSADLADQLLEILEKS